MKWITHIFFIFSFSGLFAQNSHDEIISALIDQYADRPELKCEILVHVDIEGMYIPDKKITVEFVKDKEPKVKGEGLFLLPKKGSVDQFRKLLTSPFQAIYLSKTEGNLVYKLVSLDPKDDWITADIIFDEKSFLIYESTINTRKHGSFRSEHTYNDGIFPSKSIIIFDIKKFKIPLRFIGREEGVSKDSKKDKNVEGKITLYYNYLKHP